LAQYGATGYSSRSRNFLAFSIGVVSQAFQLLLLNSSAGASVSLSVVDELNAGVQGASIVISKIDLVSGNFSIVDVPTTGPGGTTSSTLELGQVYNFVIYTTDGLLRKNDTFTVTETSYTFKILLGSVVSLTNYINVLGLMQNLSCNNESRTLNFAWNDTSDVLDSVCLRVINTTSGSWDVAFSDCSSNVSGLFGSGPFPINNSFLGVATGYKGSDFWVIDSCSLDTNPDAGVFDKEGIFWSTMLLLVFASVGVIWSPMVAIVLIIGWFIIVIKMGLMALGYASVIAFVAVLGMIGIMLKR
jgi:hypothetical protein